MNRFAWILSIVWLVVTVMHIVSQQPVEWYVHAMVTALLSFEYMLMSSREKR